MALDQGLRDRPACLDAHIGRDEVGSERVQDDLKLVHSHGRPLRGVAVQQQSQARLADAGEGGELALRDVLSVHHAPNERYEIAQDRFVIRSEEHTSELQSLMRTSYAVFCLKNTNQQTPDPYPEPMH